MTMFMAYMLSIVSLRGIINNTGYDLMTVCSVWVAMFVLKVS